MSDLVGMGGDFAGLKFGFQSGLEGHYFWVSISSIS